MNDYPNYAAWMASQASERREAEYRASPTGVATEAIARAMDWNIRAYGKLACDEDAEFFAVVAVKAIEQSFNLIPKVTPLRAVKEAG